MLLVVEASPSLKERNVTAHSHHIFPPRDLITFLIGSISYHIAADHWYRLICFSSTKGGSGSCD